MYNKLKDVCIIFVEKIKKQIFGLSQKEKNNGNIILKY